MVDSLFHSLSIIMSIYRSVGGVGDETVSGSYVKVITGDTKQKFIDNLGGNTTNSMLVSIVIV